MLQKPAHIIFGALLAACLSACGNGSSSSTPAPSGFSGEQRDKYNSLTPEGKEYVRNQMDAYDRSTKR